VLLVGSCVFYIIGLDGQWAYFALLAASVLVNYGLGLAITRDKYVPNVSSERSGATVPR